MNTPGYDRSIEEYKLTIFIIDKVKDLNEL